MRFGILCLGLLVAVTAQGQRNRQDDTAATRRACSVADCFHERDVRDFEVIDQTHVVVYTGSQRCAFHVEVRGALCDLTFAPELYFSKTNEVPVGGISRSSEPASNRDLSIMVHGGGFTESDSARVTRDRFGEPRINTDCRVSRVESITDDQLVELYVDRGVTPPLPPMGAGQIEVGEQEEEEAAETGQPSDDDAAAE